MDGESNEDRKNWLAGELGAKEDSSLCNKHLPHLPPKKTHFLYAESSYIQCGPQTE